MKKVLFYLNKSAYNVEGDGSVSLMDILRHDSDFEVSHSFEPDASLVKDADIIFPRFEIPIKTTFLKKLEEIAEESPEKLFINHPLAKRKLSNKSYLEKFIDTDLLPNTLITNNYDRLEEFYHQLKKPLILKPIDGNGGKGIHKIEYTNGNEYLKSIFENLSKNKNKIVAQRFIQQVSEWGDKRITVFMYEPSKKTVHVRFPKQKSFICNTAAGGSYKKTEFTSRDQEIIEQIMPFLYENKITWAGVDIIGPYLGEINVSSPGIYDEIKTSKFMAKKLKEYICR